MSVRVYTVSASGLTIVNAVVTLAFINPAAATGIRILRCWIGQSANATSAQQRVQLVSQVTAFPTLVSTTPSKADVGGAASAIVGGTAGAAGTAGVNASAEGAGGKTVLVNDVFNVVNGWLWIPTEKEQIVLNAGIASGFGIYLPVAAAQLANWAVGLTYEETT